MEEFEAKKTTGKKTSNEPERSGVLTRKQVRLHQNVAISVWPHFRICQQSYGVNLKKIAISVKRI